MSRSDDLSPANQASVLRCPAGVLEAWIGTATDPGASGARADQWRADAAPSAARSRPSRGTEGARRHGHAASAAVRDRAGGVLRPHNRPPVHRRLRRLLQAREPVARAHPRVSEGRSSSRGRCSTSPIRTTCSHRERRWRSSRRDTIWSGSNRASAAPERFGEFRARCREELAGQADKLNELCARERPRVRRPSSTARATESTTTPRSSSSCQAIADGTDRQRPMTSRARRAGSRGSRAARGRSRRTT